ncbi:MAG: DivIVA domain-containing protein [Bacteroidota bacterium]
MRLKPLDIKKHAFRQAVRGYDKEDVRAFLAIVADQFRQLQDELGRLRTQMDEAKARLGHYARVEEALQEALRTARETSKQKIEGAQREAEVILREARSASENAEREAEQTLREASIDARRILQDAERQRNEIVSDLGQLEGRRDEAVAQIRGFLISQMEMLTNFEGRRQLGSGQSSSNLFPIQQAGRAETEDEETYTDAYEDVFEEGTTPDAGAAGYAEAKAQEDALAEVEGSEEVFGQGDASEAALFEDEAADLVGEEEGPALSEAEDEFETDLYSEDDLFGSDDPDELIDYEPPPALYRTSASTEPTEEFAVPFYDVPNAEDLEQAGAELPAFDAGLVEDTPLAADYEDFEVPDFNAFAEAATAADTVENEPEAYTPPAFDEPAFDEPAFDDAPPPATEEDRKTINDLYASRTGRSGSGWRMREMVSNDEDEPAGGQPSVPPGGYRPPSDDPDIEEINRIRKILDDFNSTRK